MGGVKPGLILSWVALFLFADSASGAVLKKAVPRVLSRTNSITIPFAENKGQLEDSSILFYSNTFACRVSVSRDGIIGLLVRGRFISESVQQGLPNSFY